SGVRARPPRPFAQNRKGRDRSPTPQGPGALPPGLHVADLFRRSPRSPAQIDHRGTEDPEQRPSFPRKREPRSGNRPAGSPGPPPSRGVTVTTRLRDAAPSRILRDLCVEALSFSVTSVVNLSPSRGSSDGRLGHW